MGKFITKRLMGILLAIYCSCEHVIMAGFCISVGIPMALIFGAKMSYKGKTLY